MKVMILVPTFGKVSPIEGAFLFAKYLKEHNQEVLFVSLGANSRSKNNIIKEIDEAGINHECLDIRGWRGVFQYKSRIRAYCQEKAVHVVITYLLKPTLIASSITDVVKFAYVRGMLREDYFLTYGRLISEILLFLEIRALRKMDHVFSMTNAMTNWLVSEGVNYDKISIIKNFVDVKSIYSSATNEQSNKRDNINIGILCNLVTSKRVEVAVVALSKLVHDYKYNNVRLQIAGIGKLYSTLTQLTKKLNVEEEVVFNGFLETPYSFITKMDLILLTSEAEGTPRCLMEALSLGKTCISSDFKGVDELILDKQTGYLFPVGDAVKLASLLDSVIKNKLYLPPERLVNFMLEDHDIDGCCEKMLCKINQLFQNKIWPGE